MSTKSDTPLKHINTERAKNNLREPDWSDNKDIVAFDTETHKGDIFIITTSSPDKNHIYENNMEILEPDEIFDILTQKYFRNTLNVWFNIGFDAEVILKVLPEDTLKILQVTNTVIWNKYEITYLPNKYLRINSGVICDKENIPKRECDCHTKNFNNSHEYYDVAQLFRNNLQGAVEEWLPNNDIEKNEQEIDTSKFDQKTYIKNNYELIKEYAIDDVILTRQITEKLIQVAEDIDIPCGKPFSTGYLAENYLKNRLSLKVGWGCDSMQAMAWESFAGGRFEVFKRGDIGSVVGPDINSAYPNVMSDLPDPATLEWKYYHKSEQLPTISEIQSADYGFIKATITTNENKTIQPFNVKMNGVVKYPILKDIDITTLKDIFCFALENDYIQSYDIEKVFLGYEQELTRYPFGFFPSLYKQRKEWEDNDKYRRAWLLKIILNSMYGKTAQTQYNVELLQEDINISEIPEGTKVSSGPQNEVPHLKTLQSGSLFNPFIASYTTGLTRLELHKKVEEYGLIDNVILFATDSIMVDSEAYYDSDFQELIPNSDIPYSDQLGQWDFDYEGKAFVIGSGVYEVQTEKGIKIASRGFKESQIESYKQQAKTLSDKESFVIQHNRPYTLGEAIHQKQIGNTDIGLFFSGERELQANFDQKRNWKREDLTWKDLLSGIEESTPLILQEG